MKERKLKELKENLESVEITYDYEESYNNLYNLIIEYGNNTQNWELGLEEYFNDIVNYDIVEEMAKHELETGGLVRLYYFMGDANFNNDIFRINGYGNIENITKDDLDCLKSDLLEAINEKLKE